MRQHQEHMIWEWPVTLQTSAASIFNKSLQLWLLFEGVLIQGRLLFEGGHYLKKYGLS